MGFREGNANFKYFHAITRGRKQRFFIHKISDDHGNSIDGDENIATVVCSHFEGIFTGEEKWINEQVLTCIPRLVTENHNQMLQQMPTIEELKMVVFSMSPNSAAGPDGMTGKFFRVCWEVISQDLLDVVQYFFCGHSMPKYFSHACLVLLPKVEHPNKLSDFRPISLSNFTNKVISKLNCLRLAPILPLLISDNQSGFVTGRSIFENIMLAQEYSQH